MGVWKKKKKKKIHSFISTQVLQYTMPTKLTDLVGSGITGINKKAIANPANPSQGYVASGSSSCAPFSPAGHGNCCAINPSNSDARIVKPDPVLGGSWAWVDRSGSIAGPVQCTTQPN